jgi:hypothetical protein
MDSKYRLQNNSIINKIIIDKLVNKSNVTLIYFYKTKHKSCKKTIKTYQIL